MNTRNKLWMAFAVSSALLTACLDSSDSATSSGAENRSGMDVVASADDLPDCETANNGEQVYVTEERMARVCVNGKWQAVGSSTTNTVYVSTTCETKLLKDSSGVKIICGGDSIGVVKNGTRGIQGEKGETGAQGIQGEKGDQGVQGAKGDKGEAGTGCVMEMLNDGSGLKVLCNGDSVGVVLNGAKGEKGDQGIQGEKGDKGDQGEQGIQGEKGATGAQGIQGEKGDTGEKGEQGEQGVQGEKGDKGEAGTGCVMEMLADASGLKVICNGDSVGVVLNGAKGDKGDKGDQGDTGATGLSAYEIAVAGGYTGTEEEWIASLKGEKGDKGDTGSGCTATAFSSSSGSGYNIVCGGTVVGQVKNGVKGDKGDQGDPCTAVALDDDSGYKVMCGEDSVGVLKHGSGCHVTRTASDTLLVICGPDTVLAKKYAWDEGDAPEGAVILSTNFDYMTDDRDGQVYKTVVIGGQTWMAQNLNYDYNVGSAKSYCYNLVPKNCEQYGRLYNWHAAIDSAGVFSNDCKNCSTGDRPSIAQGVCPAGWRIPNYDDWTILKNMISANPYNLTDSTIYNWPFALGFDIKYAGFREAAESAYTAIETSARFWSTSYSSNRQLFGFNADHVVDNYNPNIYYSGDDTHNKVMYSVRCIKKEVGE